MKKTLFTLFCIGLLGTSSGVAQRIQQPLGRGVVAVQNGSDVLISWRKLAQEPEDATYNVYQRNKEGNFTRLNDNPLTHTHFKTNLTKVPLDSEVAVALIGNDGKEMLSDVFAFEKQALRNIFFDIDFHDSPLPVADYTTKYVWPVDLDGDGEYDFVVDRLRNRQGVTDKLEGYLRTGEHLWTIDMGPNEFICMGQDDQVLAYDIDCDGKGEVVIQTSDGTRFWDKEKRTWGDFLLGKEDTDDDGIIDYETQNQRNAPRYMTVVDGMTGREKATVEQIYTAHYNRDNRPSLMGDEYNKHVGHVGVFYHDGIHPAVVMEYHTRTTDGAHHYYNGAWAFDFAAGKAQNWHQLFNESTGGATFHQIRIADPDGDGRDEMIEGGYTMDHTGKTLFNTGISHGDRFRTTDIDPERPGLETFAIQQNAGDMLGQILYDAATGEPIKKWYLPAVGDVGRGECIDLDPEHWGYEMFSTMAGMYDAKGELIAELPTYFPTEGFWWDGELDRERLDSPDGSGFNIDIRKYNKGANTRLFEIAKSSGYKYVGSGKKLGLFMGDIIGDWREEVILRKQEAEGITGITGFSTDYSTDIDYIYCLQEDPAYRLQCTTRGYYQSPCTGFYLGYDMPRPQLPPCMVTDLVCQTTNSYTDYSRGISRSWENGKSLLFDLYTEEKINFETAVEPGTVYAMPVKGQTITLSGSGNLGGTSDFWKGQSGTLVADIPLMSKGKVIISEGILVVNTEINGTTDLRARGTLAGNGCVNEVILEGALNHEGGRIAPSPCLTFRKGLSIDHKTYLEMDLDFGTSIPSCDLIKIEGNLALTTPAIFSFVVHGGNARPGKYRLMEYTGEFSGDETLMSGRGLDGISYEFVREDHAIYLVINEQRAASEGVEWNGQINSVWDYSTPNFLLDGKETEFVSGDEVIFTDVATTSTVDVNGLMPVKEITVDNNEKDYLFSGEGGFSGHANLIKKGSGKVSLHNKKSNFTGATFILEGTVSVNELADGGLPSSLGAASSEPANLQIGKAILMVENSNTATDRGITLTDEATLQIPSGSTSLKGIVTGAGTLIKSGAGQLNLTYNGANTYSGGTILNGGTLAMGTWKATFGAPTSTITAHSGVIRIFDNNTSSAVPSFRNTLEIPEGKSIVFIGGSRCAIQGKLTGKGSLNISFPYVRGDVSTDMSAFSGTLNIISGQFRLVAATDLSQAAVVLQNNAYLTHVRAGSGTEVNLTTKIGSLASTSAQCSLGMGTYEIGHDNSSVSFAGGFSSSANILKVGTGTWTLTGSPSGSVTVKSGTLALSTDARLSGSATIHGGARLDLTGQIQNVTLNKGGILSSQPDGWMHSTGYINKNLKINQGGVIHIKKNYTRYDKFEVEGDVILDAPNIEIDLKRGSFKDGEELQIFEGYTTLHVTGEPCITPHIPAEGLAWDLSTFATDGILRVVKSTDIHKVSVEEATVGPNPTDGWCHIAFGNALSQPARICMQDMQGKTVLNLTVASGQNGCDINLNKMPEGVYLVSISCGKERKGYKLIKTNSGR